MFKTDSTTRRDFKRSNSLKSAFLISNLFTIMVTSSVSKKRSITNRTYMFSADSSETRDKWVKAIQNSVDGIRSLFIYLLLLIFRGKWSWY